jgi:hypothetical protein
MIIHLFVCRLEQISRIRKNIGGIMKVTGIILLVSGILFMLYGFLSDFGDATASVHWVPWIGMLILITGGFMFYKARDEE